MLKIRSCRNEAIEMFDYVIIFNLAHSLLRRSLPLQPPCQPPDPSRHQTRPASLPCLPPHPACHQSLPVTRPCLPTLPACLSIREVLVPSSSSCKGCICGVQVKVQPPIISYTPRVVLLNPEYSTSKILCAQSNKNLRNSMCPV